MDDYFDQFEEVTPKSKVKAKLQEKGKLKTKPDEDYFAQFEEVASQPVEPTTESPTKPLPVEPAPAKEEGGLWSTVGKYAKKGLDAADSAVGAGIQGISQGVTQGFQDELSGTINAGIDQIVPDKYKMHPEAKTFGESRDKAISDSRDMNKEYETQSPIVSTGSEFLGGLGTPGMGTLNAASRTGNFLARTGKTLGLGAASGAVNAIGGTESDLLSKETLQEAGMGAAGGAVTSLIGPMVEKPLQMLGNGIEKGTKAVATNFGTYPEAKKFVGDKAKFREGERANIDIGHLGNEKRAVQETIPKQSIESSKFIQGKLNEQYGAAQAKYNEAKANPELNEFVSGKKSASPKITSAFKDTISKLERSDPETANLLKQYRTNLQIERDGNVENVVERIIDDATGKAKLQYYPVTKGENLAMIIETRKKLDDIIPYGRDLTSTQKDTKKKLEKLRKEIDNLVTEETDALPPEVQKAWKEADGLYRTWKNSDVSIKSEIGGRMKNAETGLNQNIVDDVRVPRGAAIDPTSERGANLQTGLKQINASEALDPIKDAQRKVKEFETQMNDKKDLRRDFNTLNERALIPVPLAKEIGVTPKNAVKYYNRLKSFVSPAFAATMKALRAGEKSLSAEVIRSISKQHNVPEETIKDMDQNPEKYMEPE